MRGAAVISINRQDFCFYLGMGALFAHELDAMTHHEWRLLPLLSSLPDPTAMSSFVLLHAPLFAVLIAVVASTHPRTRRIGRLAISGFTVVHAILHTLLSGRVEYTFAGWTSHSLIYGAALFGLAALVLDAQQWRRERGMHAGAV